MSRGGAERMARSCALPPPNLGLKGAASQAMRVFWILTNIKSICRTQLNISTATELIAEQPSWWRTEPGPLAEI